jgi:tetratricopeptide (TPR) repeat protein
LKILILLLALISTEKDQLNKLRNFYQLPFLIEPAFVEKGEAYLNLSVIDIRLNKLDKALDEAKKAAYYGRKDEATYLEGVIHYFKGDLEKAASKFKTINKWQYVFFLENLYNFSIEKKLSPEVAERLPDSLTFYFVFHEKDTSKILDWIEQLQLPLWQNFLGRGYLCYKRNTFRRALNYFEESYKIRPKKYTGIYIISSLFQLSEYDSLISFIENDPVNTPLTNYIKGEVLYKKGELEKAMQIFLSDTSSKYKTSATFGAGWCAYRLANYSKSTELFEKFLTIHKEKELEQYALYRLARALLKQGKVESLEYFKRIVKEFPDSPLKDDSYLLLGKINFLLNNYDEATKWLNSLIEEFPSSQWSANAYRYLGAIFTMKGDYDMAIGFYKKILSLEWVSADLLDEARYSIEKIKWKKGSYSTKINMYKAFADKYPKSLKTPFLLLQIGEYYEAARRYDLAIQFNNKVLTKYKGSEEANEALLNLVRVFQETGDRNKAIEILKEGLRNRPELSNDINLILGEIYHESGELKKSIEYYKEVSSDILKPYTLYQIGIIYQELGLFKEARIPLNNIIENFKESEYLDGAYLYIAKTYLNEGALNKAIEILNEGLKNLEDEEIAPLLHFKAEIYCEFKDEEAFELYQKSADLTYDNKEKIKIFEDGRKCAIRLNKYDIAETFEDQINELRTSKE